MSNNNQSPTHNLKLIFIYSTFIIAAIIICSAIATASLNEQAGFCKSKAGHQRMMIKDLRELHERLSLTDVQENAWITRVLATKKMLQNHQEQHNQYKQEIVSELLDSKSNLHNISKQIDNDQSEALKQNAILRSQWLGFYDTLDINQQQIVNRFIYERLVYKDRFLQAYTEMNN